MATKLVRALFTAHVGVAQQLFEGDLWDASDPLVREHPDWFSDDLEPITNRSVLPAGEPPVEQATNNPGEKRQTRRPA